MSSSSANKIEPLWWGLFSAGGTLAAFLIPAHIVLTGLAIPLGWLSDIEPLLHHPLVRLYLFALISLGFFHAAHRFYFSLIEMKLTAVAKPLAFLCYGAAIVGTALCGWVVISL